MCTLNKGKEDTKKKKTMETKKKKIIIGIAGNWCTNTFFITSTF
jgi:hypothetical protein